MNDTENADQKASCLGEGLQTEEGKSQSGGRTAKWGGEDFNFRNVDSCNIL